MSALHPGQVVTDNGCACEAKLAVKRTEAGDRAADQADKLTVGAAKRLKMSIDSAGLEGCQDGIVRSSPGAAVTWAIEDGFDTVAAKADLINDVWGQS